MNARINNSDDRGESNIIADGETDQRCKAMMKEAWRAEAQRQLQQEQNFWHRFDLPRRKPFQRYLKATKNIDVTIPRDAEDGISSIPTRMIYPPRQQQTDATPYDIALAKTVIQPFDMSAMLADMECTPLTETEPHRQKITIQLEDEEPRVLHFVNGTLDAQELLETAIAEYLRQYNILPELVRISPSTLLRIDGRAYWTQGDRTYYRSPYGPCPVEIDITLDHMTVQCEEATYAH